MKENEKKSNENSELLQLVSFNIGAEEFAVDILKVQEINKMMNITVLPNSPDFIDGVINLRGRIIPVINLRSKLNLDKKTYDTDTRIIVLDVDGLTEGFTVDKVNEVLRIPAGITEAPPEMVAGVDSKFITAIGKLEDRLLILIDINKIFSSAKDFQLSALTA